MRTSLLLGFALALALMAATDHPARVAGVYEGALFVKGSDARKITLNLKQDGVSEFRDSGKAQHSKIEAGHWSAAGQELTVTPDVGGTPMNWSIKPNTLVLKDPDKAEYGKKGLTLRRPR